MRKERTKIKEVSSLGKEEVTDGYRNCRDVFRPFTIPRRERSMCVGDSGMFFGVAKAGVVMRYNLAYVDEICIVGHFGHFITRSIACVESVWASSTHHRNGDEG